MISLRVTELCKYSQTNINAILAGLKEPKKTKAMEMGTAYHAYILRNSRKTMPKEFSIIEYTNYLSTSAKEAKQMALEAGLIPLLKVEYEKIVETYNFLKSALDEIFLPNAEYEKEIKTNLTDEVELVGHLDCLCGEKVIDLKISENLQDLDKFIFDMRYQLQVYLYMLLSNTTKAELVFLNPITQTIQIKTFDYYELNAECEALIAIAQKNYDICQKALNEPLVIKSSYQTPQWALANLIKE